MTIRRKLIKQRLITSLVALPILFFCILFASRGLFAGLVFVISALALLEFYRISLPANRHFETSLSVAAGITSSLGIVYASSLHAVLISIVFPFFCLTLLYLFRFKDIHNVFRDLSITIFGLIYIPVLLSHSILLRQLPSGIDWVLLVLIVIMTSDSLAYFFGTKFGRHPLYKSVSPNKSLEGSGAGLFGGVFGAAICKISFFPELSFIDVFFLGIGVGVLGQLGDLVESLLKRSFNVKDSGTCFPGHGGLLDRLDSLLFAFPATYYYAIWVNI